MKISEFRKLIRQEVKKTITENSATVITEAATPMPVIVPGEFITHFKELLATQKIEADKGEVYYIIPPGKEKELIGFMFSDWLWYFFAKESSNLLDDLDTDLGLYSDNHNDSVYKSVKKGLLTKKIK